MEYKNQLDLYQDLRPVFRVKERLNGVNGYSDVTINDIWHYLAINKWKNSTNLTLSDIVNDIITVDISMIKNEGEK